MSETLEIEFKTLLTKKEYQRLIDYYQLSDDLFHVQTNVYFDTPDLQLRKKNCGLRIRLLDDHAEYTLKTPVQEGKLETTDTYTPTQIHMILEQQTLPLSGAVFQKLTELSVDPTQLIRLGELTTKRAELSIDEGLLAIDESWGQQLHDYELELEVADAKQGEFAFERLLKHFALPYRPAKNKIQRMFEAKN
ncbi:hypothetical protein A5844_002137 [Enterococcus sp. 10A9_DIV0425]|uniref:CYTH domain-containing protein n=1 Tax=Candidatus Enterococcus wittei TaxID=1987383 RepID=A0A242JYP4_9ENTE|nr:CYTH domain-containing protein [Enterococcus sp. 10A9_DIV0425]OTP10437.1 hypothetical protein A5844_002137 [Enterococcus sp. 10A9_DIV0425]THE14581.1 CYTH domain-containing protein [Enterococcus hirae]